MTFNLSEKIWDVKISGYKGTKYHKGVLSLDIAEFIRLLKEQIIIKDVPVTGLMEELDKLAGEKFQ